MNRAERRRLGVKRLEQDGSMRGSVLRGMQSIAGGVNDEQLSVVNCKKATRWRNLGYPDFDL